MTASHWLARLFSAPSRKRSAKKFQTGLRRLSLEILEDRLALTTLETGLQGYWNFDGNGLDSSGNGRDLTLVGNPGFAAGMSRQALQLHGDGLQYAIRPVSDSAFSFLGSSDFTVQIWVNYNLSPSIRQQTLIEKFTGGSGPGWTLTADGSHFQFYPISDGHGVGSFVTGAWHDIVAERAGGVFSLFYDGHQVGGSTVGGAIPDTLKPLLIGGRDQNPGFALDGKVDDVGIWNRALTTDEISTLWNSGAGTPIMGVSLLTATVTVSTANAAYTGSPYNTANLTTSVTPITSTGSFSYVYYSDAAGQTTIAPPSFAGTYYVRTVFTSSDFASFSNAASDVVPFTITPATVPMETGLQGYWNFDGNGLDSSGNGRDLTLVGNPEFVTGEFGQALYLQGDGLQYAMRSVSDSAFAFLGSSDYTVQIWVNYNLSPSARQQTLIEKFTGGGGPGWTLTSDGSHFQFYPIADGYDVGTFTTGAWHDIVAERSGGIFSLFYDGNQIAGGPMGGAITDSLNPLLIGRRNTADGRNFAVDGKIDDVGIWNRALTAGEIATLWNGGAGTPIHGVSLLTPTVTVSDNSGVYTGSPFEANGTVTGVNNTDLGTPTFTYYLASDTTFASPLTGAPKDVGSYVVVASYIANGNYTSASGNAAFQITPATLPVLVTSDVMLANKGGDDHGGDNDQDGHQAHRSPPPLTGTVNGNPFTSNTTFTTAQGDVLTVTLSSSVTIKSPVGVYPIVATITGTGNANYVQPTAGNMYVVTTGHDSGTGGKNVSFWDNKRNILLFNIADLNALDQLNLRNDNGSNFDPTTAAQLQGWLRSDADRIVKSLSIQLAVMDLNILSGYVKTTDVIYAGDLLRFTGTSLNVTGLDGGGFITVGNLMTLANNSLAIFTRTDNRDECHDLLNEYLDAIEDSLEAANNNKSFVQQYVPSGS
jgi:hypothetical protein